MFPRKKNAANAVRGKTERACDNCIRKRARWYCAADDAFLCQNCDSSVHSANPLARRHERVRLISVSSSESVAKTTSGPFWHQGITKKARTKRPQKTQKSIEIGSNPFLIVPEIGGDEINSPEEDEEKLIYRVPIFDPFVANYGAETTNVSKLPNCLVENLDGFVGNDMEYLGDQFGGDVESLLGNGLESECCFDMEALGLIDCSQEKKNNNSNNNNEDYSILESSGRLVKLEEEDKGNKETETKTEMEIMRVPFQLNFKEYDDSPKEKKVEVGMALMKKSNGDDDCDDYEEEKQVEDENKRKRLRKNKILLRLDYESVIVAWASQGSPWTTGHRPNLDCMVITSLLATNLWFLLSFLLFTYSS